MTQNDQPAGDRALRAVAERLKATVSIVNVIGETLSLRRDGRLWTALCPFHGERSPSFYVYPDHFHCFGCDAHGDVFAWLMQMHMMTFPQAVAHLGGKTQRKPPAAVARLSPPTIALDHVQHVELARRMDAPVIRFHPNCPRKDGPLPAMVALMVDPATGDPCGVHRTFLLRDGTGKAAVAKPKMMLARAGVVRLVNLEEIGVGLGLAEGIETALTVMQRIGWGPVWAATSAGAIRSFPVLRATTLNIFADHDPAGLTAARDCAARWAEAGEEVLTHAPPPGEDWADAARRLAA